MKRFLVLCIVAFMCYAAVTGTIAYFTDSVETSNVLASGNLHVVQHEYERVRNGNTYTEVLQGFKQEKPLYPAVGTSAKTASVMLNGQSVTVEGGLRNYVDKIVTARRHASIAAWRAPRTAAPS